MSEYLKFRPSSEVIEGFIVFTKRYWDAFKEKLSFIFEYANNAENAAEKYRNNENGGNLIFRPIGFLPLIKASLLIYKREEKNFEEIFEAFDSVNFNLDSKPWHYVAWNPIEKKMLMNSGSIIQLLLIYLYDEDILEAKELQKLKEGYASKISYDNPDLNNVLNGF